MDKTKSDNVIAEMVRSCMIVRTRMISRVLTGIYDEAFRPFEISSAQFALLVAIFHLTSASRAEIGRFAHLDRSTLTRNIQPLLTGGWIEEIDQGAGGRRRPIVLTKAGLALLHNVAPAWRTAQEKANTLLGEDGATAVTGVGDDILFSRSVA